MAYDATQPTNTTKIRNLGTVIRPNWTAIENAESSFRPHAINFLNRTPTVVPIDPAAIANTYILYCKQDAAGNPQIYGIDQNSRVTQISAAVSPLSAINGYTWLAGGMLLQWGKSGVIAGANTILFPIAFSAAAYNVSITPVKNSSIVNNVYVRSDADITALQFVAYNTASINQIMWMAIGPKV